MTTPGILLPQPVVIAINSAGVPISGAMLQFYVTGTTTPTPVYGNATLATPLTNPVVANGAGQFAAIFLDPTVTYRCQLQNASGGVIADIDPLNIDVVAATQSAVNTGTGAGVYVSPVTLNAWTGVPTALGYTPLNKAGDTATNLLNSPAAPAPTTVGYLGVPINVQNGNYTLVVTDAGKAIYANTSSAYAWTVPPNASVAFPVGTVLTFISANSAAVTLTPGAGVTFNWAGTGATGARILSTWGIASAVQLVTNTWLISGTNLT